MSVDEASQQQQLQGLRCRTIRPSRIPRPMFYPVLLPAAPEHGGSETGDSATSLLGDACPSTACTSSLGDACPSSPSLLDDPSMVCTYDNMAFEDKALLISPRATAVHDTARPFGLQEQEPRAAATAAGLREEGAHLTYACSCACFCACACMLALCLALLACRCRCRCA